MTESQENRILWADDKNILTVGKLRELMASLPDDMQITCEDGDEREIEFSSLFVRSGELIMSEEYRTNVWNW